MGIGSGNKLATESHLAKELGINCHTLREALLLLEQDGLIIRHRGKGTFGGLDRSSWRNGK